MTTGKPHTTGCRVCGKPDRSRGLCETHYRAFQRKVKGFQTEEEANAFELMCLEQGWVLPKKG